VLVSLLAARDRRMQAIATTMAASKRTLAVSTAALSPTVGPASSSALSAWLHPRRPLQRSVSRDEHVFPTSEELEARLQRFRIASGAPDAAAAGAAGARSPRLGALSPRLGALSPELDGLTTPRSIQYSLDDTAAVRPRSPELASPHIRVRAPTPDGRRSPRTIPTLTVTLPSLDD